MHRTLTLDYMTVVQGEVVLRLDGGECVVVRGGVNVRKNRGVEWPRVGVEMVGGDGRGLEHGLVR